MTRRLLLCAALLAALLPARAAAPPAALTLEELFPDKAFLGRAARAMAWSHDDRYLAYLWNPHDPALKNPGGADLWVYDRTDGKTRRLTDLETFAAFDRDIPAIRERYQREREDFAARRTLSAEERKKLEEEDARKDAERKEPLKSYAGVSEFRWAEKRHEMLFVYRGDLYRLKVGGAQSPARLTRTRDSESDARWTRADDGFLFRRGDGLYRRSFADGAEVQLNPELPQGMTLREYRLSPDESRLLIVAGRRAGPPARQVTYISYRNRFAEARTTTRDTGDDPDQNERYLYCVDLDADSQSPPAGDGKPWEVDKKPAGEAGDLALAEEPFSPDGKRFAYAVWRRDAKELRVWVADPATRKTRAVATDTASGEHTSPSMADPFFTPDGSRVCVMLEKSGYRHAWWIDPMSEGATQITRGDFEVYPLRFAPDGKSLVVRSSREDPSRMELYRVALPSGEMTRMSDAPGRYGAIALSHDTRRFAAVRASWRELPELVAGGEGTERTLTRSHADEAADRIGRVTPRKFSFVNRHGQTVHGYLMLPPGAKKEQRRPLLIYVYGGPLGEDHQVKEGAVDRFGTYCAETLGYVYAVIDPRGNSGYGAVFGKANYEQPGVAQVEDLTDGAKWLIENHGVDPKKVGIHGWSFGGFQTQMCLYTAPETFTLGIAGAGPTEWQNYNNWYVGGVIGAGKKAEELDRYSLTKLAKNLRAPLLLLHGMEDDNVLAQDTIRVYRELLKAGKGPLVELVLDPTGGHGLGGDISTRRRYEIYAGFLERRWGRFQP